MVLPLEILTMAGGAVLGGVLKVWQTKVEADKQKALIEAARTKAQGMLFKEAREYEDKGFQWTRRTIAIIAVLAIIVWPKFAPLFIPTWMDVVVGWTQWNPGFLFLDGSNSVEWKTAKGIVITPFDTHFLSAIAGLYFGKSK